MNIFCGRESVDKAAFIYSNVSGNTIIIVPDQYTLQAETEALDYMNIEGFIDMEILSFSRLAYLVMKNSRDSRTLINRQGRQMLISKIVMDEIRNLSLFKESGNRTDFISLMHDFIAELKQNGTTCHMLEEKIQELDCESLLYRKLQDIVKIYSRYENYTEGRYMDNEDYISEFIPKLKTWNEINGKDIWIYGFDSFTEKNIEIIKSLCVCAKDVNLVLTSDEKNKDGIFDASEIIIQRLRKETDVKVDYISGEYQRTVSEDIKHLEKYLMGDENIKKISEGNIRRIKASNPYSEACSAAEFILSLVRDQGYRYREIALICNCIEDVEKLYRRVFSDYGIELFVDTKKNAMNHPLAGLILSLTSILIKGFQKDDVLKYIKSGFITDSQELTDKLEIYVRSYNINGNRWKQEFTRGENQYSPDELISFEEMRKNIVRPLEKLTQNFSGAVTVKEKIRVIYSFMSEELNIEEKLTNLSLSLEEKGYLQKAAETAQMWNSLTEILEQMAELLGDEKFTGKEFFDMLISGIESIEIGVIPPSVDGLVMGNIQRSRRAEIRAAVIVCASEGILPANSDGNGIITEEERELLDKKNIPVCRAAGMRKREEKLALYRNIVKPSEILYMSYSASDSEGRPMQPAAVAERLGEIFENLFYEKDIFNSVELNDYRLIGGTDASRYNLLDALSKAEERGILDKYWTDVYRWFESNENIEHLASSIFDKFTQEKTDSELVRKLYGADIEKNFRLSPSRLELFGKCPFAHFIKYGIKPEQIKEFKIGPSESGTLYHQCLMKSSERISSIGKEFSVTDSRSGWMTVSKEEVGNIVDAVLKELSVEYNEGLLDNGKYERYRAERIKKVCEDSIWAVVTQIRRGEIEKIDFEISFGKGKRIPPVEIKTSNGVVDIEGQIDRWDRLKNNFSKVIDYKSGNDTFSIEEAKAGIKLQLFIYLMAVSYAEYSPAGAFYFHIDESRAETDEISSDELLKQYRLDGFSINNEEVLLGLDIDLKKPIVYKKSSERIFEKNDFDRLIGEVSDKINSMAENLLKGDIEIKPKKIKKNISCEYCKFKTICRFDISIDGCKYNM